MERRVMGSHKKALTPTLSREERERELDARVIALSRPCGRGLGEGLLLP